MKNIFNIVKDICSRVRLVLNTDLVEETVDFKRGFRYAYNLFIIGLEKDKDLPKSLVSYNQEIVVKELEAKIVKLKTKIEYLEVGISRMKQENEGIWVKPDSFIHVMKSIQKKFNLTDEEELKECFTRYIKGI